MLLNCFYHYKLKDFHFISPKFLKQGRLGGGETGVHIWVLRESTAPSTTTAPGSCCIPAGLGAAVHLKSHSRSKRRVLDIVSSQCKYCKSCDLFSNAFHRCGVTQIDFLHNVCLGGQHSNTESVIRPVRHSTCRQQFHELQIKVRSQLITWFS